MFPPVREPPVKRTYKKREPKVRPPPVPEEPLPAKRSRGLSSAAAAALKNPTNTWGTALRSAPGAGGGGGAPATWAGGQRGPGGWGGYRPPPLPKLPPIMTMPQNFQAADAVRLRNLREALDVFREEARETHQTRLAAMEDAREALRDARGEALQRYLRNVRLLEELFNRKELWTCVLDGPLVQEKAGAGADGGGGGGTSAPAGGGAAPSAVAPPSPLPGGGGGGGGGGGVGARRWEELRKWLQTLRAELGRATPRADQEPAAAEAQKRVYSTSLFGTLMLRLEGSKSLDDPDYGLLGIVNEYCTGFRIDKESHFAAGLKASAKEVFASMNRVTFAPETEAAAAAAAAAARAAGGAPGVPAHSAEPAPENEEGGEDEDMGEDGGESSESESSGDVLTEAEREKIRAEAAAEREALLRSCFEPQEPQEPARGESGLLLTEEAEVAEVVGSTVRDVEAVARVVESLVEGEGRREREEARAEAAARAAAQVARRPPKVKLVPERQLPPCLFRAPLTRWLPGAPLPKEALRAPAIALPGPAPSRPA